MPESKTNIENTTIENTTEGNLTEEKLSVASPIVLDAQLSLRRVENEYIKATDAYDPEAQWAWIQAGIDIATHVSSLELLRFRTFLANFYYELEHRHELAIAELRSALAAVILGEQFLTPEADAAKTQLLDWLKIFGRARVSVGQPVDPAFDFYEVRALWLEVLDHYDEYRMDRTLPGKEGLQWHDYLKNSSIAARLKTSFAL